MQHRHKKRFGQHFLCDQQVIHSIIAAIDPQPNDHFFEIGAGEGALTFVLAMHEINIDAIEIDRDLIPLLKQRAAAYKNVSIHAEDILQTDLQKFLSHQNLLRIVGNLPYNISSPIIFRLLEQRSCIKDMHLMLQLEVARRVAAIAGHKDYGRLSVMVQYYSEPELLLNIPKEAFQPPPEVTSAVIRIRPYHQKPWQANNEILFAELVKTAFQFRRKTIANALKKFIQPREWDEIALDSKQRPENLSVQDFVHICNYLTRRE